MKKVLLSVFVIVCGWQALSFAEPAEAPQQAVESFLGAIRSMNFPIKDEAQHKDLVQKADAYLDLEALGKKSLGNHWTEANPQEQKSFIDLLWKLIESMAYSRSHSFMGDFKITYPEVKQVADGFEVKSLIKQEEDSLDVHVNYHMYSKDDHWKVDDIVLDDVSISEDLKGQFDKIIQQSQFAGLLAKMQEKLTASEKANREPAPTV